MERYEHLVRKHRRELDAQYELLYQVCERTSAGQAFRAIREDEVLAETLGIDTTRYKLLAFALSSGFAGLAGGLYASYVQLVSPVVARRRQPRWSSAW